MENIYVCMEIVRRERSWQLSNTGIVYGQWSNIYAYQTLSGSRGDAGKYDDDYTDFYAELHAGRGIAVHVLHKIFRKAQRI